MEDKLFTAGSIVGSLVVLGIVIVALIFIKNVLIKKVAYQSRHEKKNTIDGLIFNLLQYIVIIAGLFAILAVNGIQITGLLASLGIAATVVGLSLQDTFKDLFAGINIYSNNFYKVGDYVVYNKETCIVKFFNARISKFQSLASGSTYTVSNSTISAIEKMKNDTNIPFFFDFDVDSELVDEALNIVVAEMKKMDICLKANYMGLVDIKDNAVRYLISMSAKPNDQFTVKVKAYTTAFKEFKARGIAPQFDGDRDIVISDKATFYGMGKTSARRINKKSTAKKASVKKAPAKKKK